MMSVYLSALGIACTLGRGKEEVTKSLFQKDVSPIQSKWSLLSQKSVPVGRIPFNLPELPVELALLNSRNNQILKVALDEIRESIVSCIEKYGSSRVGVVMGTSTSGMYEQERAYLHKHATGESLDSYHETQSEISSPSLFVSQYFKILGPAYTISTACSSSGKALCAARRLITAGICDAVIVGGVDSLCDITLNGFDSLGLLSNQICNPFSKNRDGITIGEGAAVFLATREDTNEAIEFCGYGESSDAYHISGPDPDGIGVQTAINQALKYAGLKPQDICYINLHGTGTELNDSMEGLSVNQIFGEGCPCSSTKSLTGHTLGASGAIEAAFLWLAMNQESDGRIPLPPHRWDGSKDPMLPSINLVDDHGFASPINGSYVLMSNSFAFGGSNVSIILKKRATVNSIVKLLPHDAPMVLIDRVISYTEDSIHCQVNIHAHSPFCENREVPSYIAIEYMAQAIAGWNGMMAKKNNEQPKIGFLLGTRRMELNVPSFKIGDVLDVYGKALYIDGEMASFDCWIDIKGERVVHAGLNVFQP
jgi:3-oxoacyl-[acyl-carrier-protein] synthase-1